MSGAANPFARLAAMVEEAGAAAFARIHDVKGSAPREAGAWLAVRPDGAFAGTIGGGRLEWDVLTDCRKALESGRGPALFLDYALGPDLGQCCGGRVIVSIETFDGRDAEALRALAGIEGRFEVRCWVDEGGRVVRG